MKRRFREVLGAFAIVTAIAVSSCGGSVIQSQTQNTGGFQLADYIKNDVKSGKKLVIRVDYHDPSLAFAIPIRKGVAQAAQDLNVDAELIGPTGGSAQAQVAELQTLIIQKKVDGLAVSSAENNALKPVIAQAYNAGIPIISFNTNNPGSKQMAFVGQDLVKSGYDIAQQLVKDLNGRKGKVVVFSVDSGAGWSNDRFSGFQQGLGSSSGLTVVGPVNTGNEPNQGYNVVQNTMAANSDAIAIASLDCCSLDMAATWQQQNHKNLVVVGFDALPKTLQFIRGGMVETSISQNPFKQGYDSVKILVAFLRNGTSIQNENTGSLVVDKSNVDTVAPEG